MINILFIGDIVGKSGRNVVLDNISSLCSEYVIDLVIANGENAAHGKGLSYKNYLELKKGGVEVFTMGNHTFSKAIIFDFIDEVEDIVRPLNIEPIEYGKHYVLIEVNNIIICIFNVLGNIFMEYTCSSCFEATDKLLSEVKADIYFCDFHGEATSEKIAYAYNYQDKIQAIVGTHTHVQTADERIIGNLAFISDVGMCGAFHSILGRSVEETLTRIVKKEKTRYEVAYGPAIFCGAVISIDEQTKKAVAIRRIQIRPDIQE